MDVVSGQFGGCVEWAVWCVGVGGTAAVCSLVSIMVGLWSGR